MDSDKIKDWLLHVVTPLVFYPDQVLVTKSMDEMGVLYTLKVADGDAGKIIGREGQTAKALRVLLRCVQTETRMRVSLKIDIPEMRRDGDSSYRREKKFEDKY